MKHVKKLNLGAGTNPKKGWVNIDILPLRGVDIVHNLEKLPLPFRSREFDFILSEDVFEHINYVPLMKELHRILKPKGIMEIRIPHFSSAYNFIDPTHKNLFSSETMSLFTKTTRWNRFYFDYSFNRVIYSKIEFDKSGWLSFNKLIEKIVNYSQRTKSVYEFSFLRNLFPASNIYIRIER